MGETLFEVAGFAVTITWIYGIVSILILVLFISLWLLGRKKRTAQPVFAGQVINGVGFGLLPALSVLKAFQEMNSGSGASVIEPLPGIGWLTEEGHFMPGRIETVLPFICFTLLCIWLIFRKHEMPDNGDLLIIALCLWATIRLITEDFRSDPQDLFRFASCGTELGCLIIILIRRYRIHPSVLRTVTDVLAACICIAANLFTAKEILTVGSDIGDFAVKAGSAILLLTIVLIVGGDLRKMKYRK